METSVGTDLHTMGALANFGAQKFGDRPAQRFKRGGEWEERSYGQLAERAGELALGLVDLGIAPGDRVCILANTRPEWTDAELAIWMAAGVVVPIYQTNSPEECEWVAGNSGAVAVFCEDETQLEKIRAVRERLPELEHVILIDGEADGAVSLEDLRGRGADAAELERRVAGVKPADPMLFIYTWGRPGRPRAAC